ncbi:MAG: DNA gyrase/topoisomerase IV subunit A, partial [Bacteroidota bacterium]
IINNKPCFVTVTDLLKASVNETRELLKQELEIKLGELQDKWHFTSLEKIFFEEKIYKELEEKHASWETVLEAIEKAFAPYKKKLRRPIERADILKLTEKPVRRIYRLDIKELNDQILQIEENIREVEHNLDNLTDYAVAYFENLLKKYGKDRTRKTLIKEFDTIQVKHVAIANTKLYMNRAEGFIGTGLKKDELLCECSDYDDIIAFTKGGTMKVVKVADKVFIGKDIIHAAVFRKNDDRTTYNMIYVDGKTGISYAKRFNVTGVTRDKEYDLTKGEERSKVHYFSSNPNGEAESVRIVLSPASTARIKEFDFFFEELEIKGRSSIGNQVTKYSVKSIRMKEAGKSTLAGIKLWFDDKFGRLNTEAKGKFLGTFEDEKIIVFSRNGTYEITDTELNQRFEPENILLIQKYLPEQVISAVYLDQDKKQFNVKRFVIETSTLKTPFTFIKEGTGNYLVAVTTQEEPMLIVTTGKGQQVRKATFKVAKMVEVTGWKTVGTKLTDFHKSIEMHWQQNPKEDNAQPELFE